MIRRLTAGRFGYGKSDRAKVEPRQTIDRYPFDEQSAVHQYAGDYTQLEGDRDLTIDFAGSTKAQLIDAQPHSGKYFMWSNRADVADLRLQREFDLSDVKNATLKYWTWYDLEKDWDYAYVSVSEDGGQTWKLLKAPSMTDSNPTNANYGWGYTGKSGGGDRAEWIQESIDLTPYAGKKIVVAFDVINDMAVNRPALALDDVEVPEINYRTDFEKDDGGWQPTGWIRHQQLCATEVRRAAGELWQRRQDRSLTLASERRQHSALGRSVEPVGESDCRRQPHGVQDHRGGAL